MPFDTTTQLHNLPLRPKPHTEDLHRSTMEDYNLETALPQIDAKEPADLDNPLLKGKFLDAIKGLISRRCPGPDGFSPRFYKSFVLSPASLLSAAFNSMNDSHLPSKDLLTANRDVLGGVAKMAL